MKLKGSFSKLSRRLRSVKREKLSEEAEDKQNEQNDEICSLNDIMKLRITVGTVVCAPNLGNCGSDKRLPPVPKLTLPLFDGQVAEFLTWFDIFHSIIGDQVISSYGYVESSFRVRDGIQPALIRFQEFHGLDKTGTLDENTIHLMQQPRCGLPDFETDEEDSSNVRFRLRASKNKWNRNFLTYAIGSYAEELQLEKEGVHLQIREAFNKWSERKPWGWIQFLMEQVEFWLMRFFPGSGGNIHFDDAETWQLKKPKRTFRPYKQLYQIAVHEIGHSLGLTHSRDKTAVMAPVYNGWNDNIQLSNNDIKQIQRRYGTPKKIKAIVPKRNTPFDASRINFFD
ncbi:MMP14 [Lepeophtheirus salmonis]|uniref:MMP14 n=1 Tax=Lepeophtheirus salmonis TaxID=72036 RepID=A0A7R8CB10_LEPSM|nr:MMP14 [Lepeophtheirus salmonis]CAF2754005.1 MMP14 [Lepeophtheirus salmonis]